MAVKAGHASLIYESTAKNLGKLLSCMVSILACKPFVQIHYIAHVSAALGTVHNTTCTAAGRHQAS
jgi:hypothetical protein